MSDLPTSSETATPAEGTKHRVVGRKFGQANQLIINTLSNYALTFVSMVTSLVMTPIVIKHLGQNGFGMSAMVLATFGMFEVLSSSFGRAIQRHIPQSLSEEDPRKLNRAFSTGLCGYLVIGVIGAGVVWLMSDYLLKSEEAGALLEKDGFWAMATLEIWLLLGFPFWAYRKGLEAIQRFDLLGFLHGIITVLRMVMVIVVFWMGYGSVTFFVASQFAGLLIINFLSRRALMRCLPDLSCSPKLVDKTSLWLMGSFAAATILGTGGEILGGFGFRIFVGKSLGLAELGDLAAVSTLILTIGRLSDELTNAFTPTISALDARGSLANVAKLMVSGTKISILITASMSLVPFAAAAPFLHLWLGPEFARLDNLLWVLLLLQVPMCLGKTAMHVLYGLGHATTCGLILFFRAFVGIAAAFLYVGFFNAGVTHACLCMFGAQALGSAVVMFYGCKATETSWIKAPLRDFLHSMGITLAGAAATYGVLKVLGENAWWKVGVSVVCGEGVFFLLVLLTGLCIEEWQKISSFLVSAQVRIQRTILRSTPTADSERPS